MGRIFGFIPDGKEGWIWVFIFGTAIAFWIAVTIWVISLLY